MVNLQADIVPGTSAAGFFLGQRYSQLEFGDVAVWNRSQGPLNAAIDATEGWLRIDMRDLAPTGPGGEVFYCLEGAVRLQFGATGVLYSICVFAGYQGTYAGNVRVGDRLDSVLKHMAIWFDSGDEMHYPVEDSGIVGIAFLGSSPLDEEPDQVIDGICVHDWNLERA